MRLTGYETFCLYLALKNHFTQDKYDFFKYKGKVKVPQDTFLRRRDRFQFEKLARKYNADQMRDLLVANFLADKSWVGDMLEDEAHDRYLKYVKVKQSLSYTFSNDIDLALASVPEPQELFRIHKDQYPKIIELLQRQEVTLETVVILNSLVGFSEKYNTKLSGSYIWDKINVKLQKYTPFVEFDKKKFAKVFKDKLDAAI